MYTIMNSEPAYKTTKTQVTSLNMTVRKQEYDRIARENQVPAHSTVCDQKSSPAMWLSPAQ